MSRILGMMVVGKGESKRYLNNSLKELKRLCDGALIVGNNTDPEDEEMIKSFGFDFYRDDRVWGLHQPSIKTDLLTKLGEYKPDAVIGIDSDETFAPEFTREEAEKLLTTKEIAFHFLVVNLYNDEEHFAHGVGIQRFWNVRFFRYLPQYGLQYQRKNLHCGLAPPIMYQYGWYAPFYLKHYGLMKKEDRDRKVARYKEFDPTYKFKSKVYYDDLEREMPVFKFEPQALLNKIRESQEGKPRITPKSIAYEQQ